MKYKVTVGNLGIAEANQIIRICSEKGFGIPEFDEIPEKMNITPSPVITEHKPKFRRKEIVVTAVAPDGSSQTGNSVEAAEFIAAQTGKGASASNMMKHFRAGNRYRGFTGVIVADSRRIRKNTDPVPAPISVSDDMLPSCEQQEEKVAQ